MTLHTHCPGCGQPVTTTLPDATSEAEAQAIASRLYCVPCAMQRAVMQGEKQTWEPYKIAPHSKVNQHSWQSLCQIFCSKNKQWKH
jgi:hypothetical protein